MNVNDMQGNPMQPPMRPSGSWVTKVVIGCLAGCGILLLAVIGLAILAFRTGSKVTAQAAPVAMRFLQDVNNNKSEQAYALTNSEFRGYVSLSRRIKEKDEYIGRLNYNSWRGNFCCGANKALDKSVVGWPEHRNQADCRLRDTLHGTSTNYPSANNICEAQSTSRLDGS